MRWQLQETATAHRAGGTKGGWELFTLPSVEEQPAGARSQAFEKVSLS